MMTIQAETTRTIPGPVSAESERRAGLRGLSGELQDVHRGLMEISRDRYERANGSLRNRTELLDLLLHDQTFAWLRPLSRLIVEIDELASRDPAPTEAEATAMGARVQIFTSASDDPDAFGSRYVELLTTEPRVAMSHVGLRAAVSDVVGI